MKNLKSVLDEKSAMRNPFLKAPSAMEEAVIRYRADEAIRWIQEDISRGILPGNLTCFCELHDWVDANMYLLDEAHPVPRAGSFFEWTELGVQGVCDRFNRVIEIVDDWLATQSFIRGGRQ